MLLSLNKILNTFNINNLALFINKENKKNINIYSLSSTIIK